MLLVFGGMYLWSRTNGSGRELEAITPVRGDVALVISTVGTVMPQNRLEIKPPINGRVERILVTEGQVVKKGQVLAYMSSMERATLIDAARLKGAQEFAYWQQAYRETPIVAPIDGVVIVRDIEPGQTVTTASVMIVLSDRLIVEADVDETDVGVVRLGQQAIIGLDAYPEISIDATVDHISYESEVINNVTVYKVDILPKSVPEVFRSGMSANVEILAREEKNALLIPADAVRYENGEAIVSVQDPAGGTMKRVVVETGLQQDGFIEIVSGLTDDQTVLAPGGRYVVPKKENGTSPFFPSFRRGRQKRTP